MTGLKKASHRGGKQQSIQGFFKFKSTAVSSANQVQNPDSGRKLQFVPPKVATPKPVATVKPVLQRQRDQSPVSASSVIDLTSTSPDLSKKNSVKR